MEYVNLLPDNLRARELWRSRVLKWGFVALVLALLVIGYSLVIGGNVASVRQELVPLERQVAKKEELNQQFARLEEELQRAVEKKATLKEVVDQRDWACAFADIAEAAKDNAWLERTTFAKVKIRHGTSGEGTDDGEGVEEQEIVQFRFTAQGYADSNFELANFMAKLERSRLFDDVELNYSELKEFDKRERHIQFEIEGTLL